MYVFLIQKSIMREVVFMNFDFSWALPVRLCLIRSICASRVGTSAIAQISNNPNLNTYWLFYQADIWLLWNKLALPCMPLFVVVAFVTPEITYHNLTFKGLYFMRCSDNWENITDRSKKKNHWKNRCKIPFLFLKFRIIKYHETLFYSIGPQFTRH